MRTQTGWWLYLFVAVSFFLPGCASFKTESPPRLSENRNVPIAVRRFTAESATPAKTAAEPQLKVRKNNWRSTQDVHLTGYEPILAGRAEEAAPRTLSAQADTVSAATDGDSSADFIDPRELDLSTSLQLVGGQSPQVAFADQRIQEAQAGVNAAGAMWLPSIRAGVSLHRHEGNLQASNGAITDVNRSSLQTGFGANAVGAGTTATPGLSAQFHLSDAVFAPRIAERTRSARQFSSRVTYHDEMLRAAEAYIELLRAHQARAIAGDTLTQAAALAEQMAVFARTGQGNPADSDRAGTELAIRTNHVLRASEAIEVASARLVEVLHLDAPTQVVPTEQQLAPIEMVSLEATVQHMVANGLASRPELGESRELVEAACERLRREQFAPVMPSVLLGLSYGGFGGGRGDRIADVDDRLDFDLGAVWEIRNLGWGDSAARDAASARVEQARYQEMRVLDRVAREIIESRAQVRSRKRQIETARSAIDLARSAYRRDLIRVNEGQGLPLEVLQSLQALDRARRDYLNSVASFNTAQFRLHHAIGWPSNRLAE
ncbi:MAG: TolC family protein [Planctomycetaceae bacterium]